MKCYTPEKIKAILDAHRKWLKDEDSDSSANLSGADLSGADLYGANLSGANLSGADLYGANLSGANLSGADLYGANLSGADLSGADLYGANLSVANLSRADLYGADLSGANLYGANLYGADLSGANLYGANLYGANLSGANLSGADLYETVKRLAAVPSLHRRILAALEAGGALEMGKWHTCETTHCRAGWAIHLAGSAGQMLEACVGPVMAGALIHLASCPQLDGKVPDFYATNEEALKDIRRLAELEPPIEETAGAA